MNLHFISFLVWVIGVTLLTCVKQIAPLADFIKIVTGIAAVIWVLIEIFGAVPLK